MRVIKATLCALIAALIGACQELKMAVMTNIDLQRPVLATIESLGKLPVEKAKVLKFGTFLAHIEVKTRGNWSVRHTEVNYARAKIEIFSPKHKNNTKVIYWIHGGAFVYPLSNIFRDAALYMLKLNDNYDIAFVDYSTYPKAYYPQANIESEDALRYLEQRYHSVNIIGDSAGANLALSILIKRNEERKKLVNALVLYSPFLDIAFELDSRERNKHKDIFIGNPFQPEMSLDPLLTDNPYFRYEQDKKNPLISPIYYDRFDNFPPTYIEVGRDEVLYDDSKILYDKLPHVTLVSIPHLFHDFQSLIFLKEARQSLQRNLDFFDEHN